MKNGIVGLIIFIGCFVASPAKGSNEAQLQYDSSVIQSREFNEEVLKDHLQSGDFNYEPVERESWLPVILDWLAGLLPGVDIDVDGSAVVTFFKVLQWLLMIAVVGLLVYALLKMTGTGIPFVRKPGQEKQSAEMHWEEELPEETLKEYLEQAIKEQDFRKALRLQYLLLLNQMDRCGMIRWTARKTNRELVREVSGSEVEQAFRRFVRRFNYVWYGHFSIDKHGFEHMQEEAQSIVNTLPAASRT